MQVPLLLSTACFFSFFKMTSTALLYEDIQLKPGFSKGLAIFLAVTYSGAIMIVWGVVDWGDYFLFPLGEISLTLLLISSGLGDVQRYLYLQHHPLYGCYYNVLDAKTLLLLNGQKAEILTNSYVHPYLTIVKVVLPDGTRHQLLLLPDNIDATSFRRLRVGIHQNLQLKKADNSLQDKQL